MPTDDSSKLESIAKQRFDRMSHRSKHFWIDTARDASEAKANREWEILGYAGFDEYLKAACGWCKSQAYVGMGALERLKELPEDVVQKMSLGNAALLGKIPPKERDADLIRSACLESEVEFAKTLQANKPAQHVDVTTLFTIRLHETAKLAIIEVLDEAKKHYDCASYGEALEYVCQEAQQSWSAK